VRAVDMRAMFLFETGMEGGEGGAAGARSPRR
jgi:hypothetical protein